MASVSKAKKSTLSDVCRFKSAPSIWCIVLLCFLGTVRQTSAALNTTVACIATPGDFSSSTAIGFCTDAVYIALKPSSGGSIGFVQPSIDSTGRTSGIASFASRKDVFPDTQFYLGITGSGSDPNVQHVLSGFASSNTFVQRVLLMMQNYPQYRGIYVDFEGLTPAQKDGYNKFIDVLTTVSSMRGYIAAAAIPANSTTSSIYFSSHLEELQFVLLKSYENFNAGLKTTHPIAPLGVLGAPFNVPTKTITTNLNNWIQAGIPASKIVLGLPMYSVQFTVTTADRFGRAATALSTDTYCSALLFSTQKNKKPATPVQGESFVGSGNKLFSFNSYDAAMQKVHYATTANLAGVAVYSLNTAGSANAELLRYIVTQLDPTGSYPAAGPSTCGVPPP